MQKKVKARVTYISFLSELKPCNLVRLRQKFAGMTGTVSGIGNGALESLTKIPETGELLSEFHEYRNGFAKELSLLRITKKEDAEVIIAMNLLDDAREPQVASIVSNNLPDGSNAKLSGKVTRADFVVQVYLEHSGAEMLRKALHQHGTVKQKGYVYYTPAFRETLNIPPVFPDDAKLDSAEGILSHDFEEYLDEKLCDISPINVDGKWYFDIVHGGYGEQGERINETSEREDYALQRPEYDTLIFDPLTGDLMIHMQSKRNKIAACYLHVLSMIIFGVEDYWIKKARFSTLPLCQPVEKIRRGVLRLGSLRDRNPGLLRVGLYALNLSETIAPIDVSGKPRIRRRKISDTYCLTEGMEPEEMLVRENEVIDSFDILFELKGDGDSTVNHHILIKPVQLTPKGNEVIVGLQEWLAEVGLSLVGETLEQRRKRFAENPGSAERLPKKRGREKNRSVLLERAMSSNKRTQKKQ